MVAPKLKSVTIRMYRGILGDCFLIRTSLAAGGKETNRWILIDCGVLQNVPGGQALFDGLSPAVQASLDEKLSRKVKAVAEGQQRIEMIAADVLKTVDNRIDLLIVTHEHFDHLSGFGFSRDKFLDAGVQVDRLWMAWTENFSDKQANDLRARLSKGKQALAAAATLADAMGAAVPEALANAAALAAFSGPPSNEPGMAAAPGRWGTGDVMRMLKDKAGPSRTEYLEPGQVIELADFGLKAYILGPPRDEKLLRKDAPSKGAAKEVYLTAFDAAAAAESTATTRLSLMGATKSRPESFAELTPFSAIHLRPIEDPRATGAKRRAPKAAAPPETTTKPEARDELKAHYDDPNEAWRTIDDAWTGSIEALALKMDSDTNNTSLAIAFELPDGQVLLFPGDAQVGNWLSWNDQTYPKKVREGSTERPVTAEELLRRATFYKGGHHLSHNATAKALGLERMTDPRLVAAAPLVEGVAFVQGKGRTVPDAGWKMPYPELYAALKKKTQDRIVRGDGDVGEEMTAFENGPVEIEYAEGDALWVELTFKLA